MSDQEARDALHELLAASESVSLVKMTAKEVARWYAATDAARAVLADERGRGGEQS